ncbi:MAG TPA: hypothetical protein VL860_10535, partial [Planctomycetota bacterium]|nr:hypothetical protein [Planctomycetota bacterium]
RRTISRWTLGLLGLGLLLVLPVATAGDAAPPVSPVAGAGAPEKPAAASGPQVIHVGIYVLSIGKLDIGTGSFTIDFYLSLKSDQPIPETFEFMNGRAASFEKIDDQPNEKFYRILANLSSPIDFRRFPFDAQKLQVILEDKKHTDKELVYMPDAKESGFDPSVSFAGWDMSGWETTVGSHKYEAYDETYSQYAFSVGIQRIKTNSFLKTFLPVLFLMLIMVSSFILNPDQIITKMATISSSLVASAMFHISIASQIPPVAYLTFADKFMMLTYLILLLSFFLNIGIFVAQNKGNKERALRLSKWSSYLVFIGVPVLYLSLFLFVR